MPGTNALGLFQLNPEYTDCHIETGGKNLISYTPIGEKFIICKYIARKTTEKCEEFHSICREWSG